MRYAVVSCLKRGFRAGQRLPRCDLDGLFACRERCNTLSMTVADLVRAFYEDIWNRQDKSQLDHIIAPDFRFRGSLGLEKTGPEEFWDYVRYIVEPLGEYRCEIQELVCEGPKAFAKMWFSGTHRGELLGKAG